MKSLSVRGIEEEVYKTLKECARENHRSLQEEVKNILERETQLVRGSRFVQAGKWRERLKGRAWGDLTKEVRLERAR